jgi:hypothetical protein
MNVNDLTVRKVPITPFSAEALDEWAKEQSKFLALKRRLLDRPTLLKMVDQIANATTFDLYDQQIEEIVDAVVEYVLQEEGGKNQP